jgi:hypothetical protein
MTVQLAVRDDSELVNGDHPVRKTLEGRSARPISVEDLDPLDATRLCHLVRSDRFRLGSGSWSVEPSRLHRRRDQHEFAGPAHHDLPRGSHPRGVVSTRAAGAIKHRASVAL